MILSFIKILILISFAVNSKNIKAEKQNNEYANNALVSAYNAIQHSQIAISMAAKAIATCSAYANIDCDILKNSNENTNIYLETASQSYSEAKAYALICQEYISKTPSMREVSIADMANRIANTAVQQAELAVQVTAKASAQCSIIVRIKCNECDK